METKNLNPPVHNLSEQNVASTCCGVLCSLGVLAVSTYFGESVIRSSGERVRVIASSTSCGSSTCSGSCLRFAAPVFRFVRALVANHATPTERGLESSELRAWASCSANFLTFLEEHLSKGGLYLNLLKFRLEQCNFQAAVF